MGSDVDAKIEQLERDLEELKAAREAETKPKITYLLKEVTDPDTSYIYNDGLMTHKTMSATKISSKLNDGCNAVYVATFYNDHATPEGYRYEVRPYGDSIEIYLVKKK